MAMRYEPSEAGAPASALVPAEVTENPASSGIALSLAFSMTAARGERQVLPEQTIRIRISSFPGSSRGHRSSPPPELVQGDGTFAHQARHRPGTINKGRGRDISQRPAVEDQPLTER